MSLLYILPEGLHDLPHSSQGFWQVQSKTWTLNGQTKQRRGNTTILDTGTTLLLVADDVVDEIYGMSCSMMSS